MYETPDWDTEVLLGTKEKTEKEMEKKKEKEKVKRIIKAAIG